MGDRKLDILRKLHDAHSAMQLVVTQVTHDQPIYDSWRIKDVIAHLVGWDRAVIQSLTAYLDDDETPRIIAEDGIDAYNVKSVRAHRHHTFQDVCDIWEAQRDTLEQTIRQLSNSQLDNPIIYPWGGYGTIANLLKGMAYHERQHALEIREMLNQRRLKADE